MKNSTDEFDYFATAPSDPTLVVSEAGVAHVQLGFCGHCNKDNVETCLGCGRCCGCSPHCKVVKS